MHGAGNDFVICAIDELKGSDPSAVARFACHRRYGIGSDGLIAYGPSEQADVAMHMWNPDGTESAMCGNGIRCMARLLAERGDVPPIHQIETLSGIKEAELHPDGSVTIGMGTAKFRRGEIPVEGNPMSEFVEQDLGIDGLDFKATAVGLGNPHLVFFVDEGLAAENALFWGPKLEVHPMFPEHINVHFIEIRSRNQMLQRTWERGAGITFACGTGSCAAVASGLKTGRTAKECELILAGGKLQIRADSDYSLWMTGPTAKVFTGEFDPAMALSYLLRPAVIC